MLRAAALATLLGAAPALAECRLALLLALDVSSSVDAEEDRLQRQGLAAALVAPEVAEAFFAADAPVALGAFEWSGRYNQEIILDWTLIESPSTLRRASERISASTRSYNEFPTAIGYALGFGAGMLQRGPACLQSTIDIAGDGENNEGFGPQLAYAEFPFADVTVNGLVIANAADFQTEAALTNFYAREVLHGPGAFLVVANGFRDYARAMRAKLVRELSPLAVGALAR